MIETTSYRHFLYLIFWSTIYVSNVVGKFPEDKPRCVAGDGECLRIVIDQYIKQSVNGIPSIHLVPIDPLFVPEINIIQGSDSPVNIRLNFRNANFIGFSQVRTTRVVGFDKDPNTSKYEISCQIPSLSIIGDYKVTGKVIILPVVGDGPANLTFQNLDVLVKFDPRVDIKRGKEYLQFNKVDVAFTTTRLYMQFDHLFNGDKLLGDTTNQFLNENWLDILNELKEVLQDTIGSILKNVIGSVFAAYPYLEFFVES